MERSEISSANYIVSDPVEFISQRMHVRVNQHSNERIFKYSTPYISGAPLPEIQGLA